MSDINNIAEQFVDFYYQVFSNDRRQLQSLYRDTSMLTFENQPCQGGAAIIEKLTSLPFTTVQHKITTKIVQPASTAGNIIVLVTGLLLVDDNENPLHFCQVFHLIPEGGSFFVNNDIFSLNYG